MATEIRAPYNVFFGEDGYPLEGGYIYIGVSGLNPLSNPQPGGEHPHIGRVSRP